MKVKMLAALAHPKYGCAQAGKIVDLPEEFAKQLVAGKYAVPATARESAMLKPAPEKAVQTRPDPRDRKPPAKPEPKPEAPKPAAPAKG